MLYKFQFFLFLFLFFSSSLSAEDQETFTTMAREFISNNRSVVHCELQQKRMLIVQTKEGKELKLLCVWFPQTQDEEYKLDSEAASLRNEADYVLIGYGQTAGNPMFCYYLPIKKISKSTRKEEWKKYKVPLSLCDFQFE